jgi:predicted nuclease of restriction endonuclease-like (RecB) superfamily
MELLSNSDYDALINRIVEAYSAGRASVARAVNVHVLETYWNVGRYIVEFEQGGNAKAGYGAALISNLSRDLTLRHGRGFSRSNLKAMRQLYIVYPKSQTLSGLLSWSHAVELLKIDDPLERGFYEQQLRLEKWSVRELKRQKESALFLRLAASQDREGVLRLAAEGRPVERPADLLREPYIFEFLKIPELDRVSETQLESLLCDHLQQFLLELGKGFTFVGRQYRITINNTHYRVDLVFYHRILRRFVLIDLKMDDVEHRDIGQMNLYLGYFAAEENGDGDAEPVGIILSRHKDELLVEYSTYGMNSQLFVQKYQLYLPDRDELRRELERTLRGAEPSVPDDWASGEPTQPS